MKRNNLTFLKPKKGDSLGQWLIEQGISAGFPSPADDFKEIRISLDRELVKNQESTFYARVSGDSMIEAGLDDGDLIVIDRSLDPENGKIAVCFVDGRCRIQIEPCRRWNRHAGWCAYEAELGCRASMRQRLYTMGIPKERKSKTAQDAHSKPCANER